MSRAALRLYRHAEVSQTQLWLAGNGIGGDLLRNQVRFLGD
jgi:hypothetical protein